MTEQAVSAEELTRQFAGREVLVTNGKHYALLDRTGVCKCFHPTEGGGVDIELADGDRSNLLPDKLTADTVEGVSQGAISIRRVIQLVSPQ